MLETIKFIVMGAGLAVGVGGTLWLIASLLMKVFGKKINKEPEVVYGGNQDEFLKLTEWVRERILEETKFSTMDASASEQRSMGISYKYGEVSDNE